MVESLNINAIGELIDNPPVESPGTHSGKSEIDLFGTGLPSSLQKDYQAGFQNDRGHASTQLLLPQWHSGGNNEQNAYNIDQVSMQ